MNTDFPCMKKCGIGQRWTFYAPILEQLWLRVWTQQADGGLLSAPARHICMAAVAENGITKSVTNLIKPLISNKLA